MRHRLNLKDDSNFEKLKKRNKGVLPSCGIFYFYAKDTADRMKMTTNVDKLIHLCSELGFDPVWVREIERD